MAVRSERLSVRRPVSPSLPTITTSARIAPLDRLMLWLALLQGSSFTLSIALYATTPIPTPTLAALVTALWAMMYVVAGLGLLVTFGIDWLGWLVRYRLPLVLLVAGTALSALWSIDARLSAERGAHLLGTTLVALHIGLRLPLSSILRESARAFVLLLVLSALAALLHPPIGIEDYQGRSVWRGVMASKNTLGFWAAVSTMLFATRAFAAPTLASRAFWILMIALALLCLAASVSATSVLALGVAVLVVLYLHAATSLRLGLVSMIVLGLLVAALAGLAFQAVDTAELIGRSGDLTGRAQVWEETWRLIRSRPLGGYGYGTIWFPTAASLWIQQSLTDLTWTVYHAHNGLLQIASEIGLPLTVLMLLMIVQQLVESVWCQYQRPQAGILFVIGFSVALLVSNYAEARLLVNRDLFWIFLIALPISMVQQVELVAVDGAAMPGPLPGRGAGRSPRGSRGRFPERQTGTARREERDRRRGLKRRLQARLPSDTAPGGVPAGTRAEPPSPGAGASGSPARSDGRASGEAFRQTATGDRST